jgi:hypothetical protein
VRAATARRARADRPPRSDPLHRRRGLAHEPQRGVPPRRQRLPALRARQPARAQLMFNNNGIGTYTEQRRLRACLGGPSRQHLSKHAGRVADFQDHPNRKPAVLTVTQPLTPGRPIPATPDRPQPTRRSTIPSCSPGESLNSSRRSAPPRHRPAAVESLGRYETDRPNQSLSKHVSRLPETHVFL